MNVSRVILVYFDETWIEDLTLLSHWYSQTVKIVYKCRIT